MEMTYDGMLVMPSSYAVMDEDEMCYVEGGATEKCKGVNALITISNIIGAGITGISLTVTAGKALLAAAETGIGLLLAVAALSGFNAAFVYASTQFALAVTAANYTVSSYKSTKNFNKSGFRDTYYSLFGYTIYTSVRTL